MARGKKAVQGLTPEEKLSQALVPVEEQPYRIPENWCWIQLNCIKKDKDSFFDGDWILSSDMDSDGDVRLLQLSDIGIGDFLDKSDKHISFSTYKKLNCTKLCAGDVMISRMAEPIARSCIVPEFSYTAITAVDVAIMRCNSAIIINRFLNYLCNTPWFTDLAFSRARGTTRVRITRANLGEMPLPLPPLSEQQRIVDRIESIFAKLDEAKEKAQVVVDGFELRKSAILHKAFTGELTRAWRKENGQDESNWKRVRFDEVAEIKSNLVDPAEYQEYPHIAPDNIEKKTGVLLEYHTIAEDGVKSGKHRFYAGQILYSKIRPYLSKVVIATVDGLCSADMYPIDAKGNVKFLWYYMLSDEFLAQASNSGSRSVLPKINQKELSRVMVKTTSIEEQQAIADILDSLIAKENAAKEVAEDVLNQIDTIKKAVLARAFRGELGTNDPTEESAVELLKKML